MIIYLSHDKSSYVTSPGQAKMHLLYFKDRNTLKYFQMFGFEDYLELFQIVALHLEADYNNSRLSHVEPHPDYVS